MTAGEIAVARTFELPFGFLRGQRKSICAFAFEKLEDFASNIKAILDQPGPVFVAMKVMPEIENEPIGRRQRWQTRSREQVVQDLRAELGISG